MVEPPCGMPRTFRTMARASPDGLSGGIHRGRRKKPRSSYPAAAEATSDAERTSGCVARYWARSAAKTAAAFCARSPPASASGDTSAATEQAARAPATPAAAPWRERSEEHTSELQSHSDLVCRLLL